MKQYPSYKESGVEWIGKIPSHWQVKKLKFISSIVLGKMLTNEDKGNYHLKPYLRSQNIQKERVDVTDIKNMWLSSNELQTYRLQKNDLLVSEGGDVGRTCIWENELEECYIQNSVNRVRIQSGHSKFYLFHFQSHHLTKYFDSIVNRVSIPHLTKEKLQEILFVEPSLREQKIIADYLNNKTSVIDETIRKKQRLIELLQEERTALINQAVTRGLNPDVKLKPSGVEWLGDVPEHSSISKLKYNLSVQGRIGYKGYATSDIVVAGKGALTIGAKHISKSNKLDLSNPEYLSWDKYYESPEIFVSQGQLLVVQRGSLGKICFIEEDIGPATINPSVVILKKLSADLHPLYLYWYLNSNCFTAFIEVLNTATAVPMISQEQLENLIIPLPPLYEQARIVQYLQNEYCLIQKNDRLLST